ncbi:hypothetical protein ACP275_09G056900 [Erythranthe tilingii]
MQNSSSNNTCTSLIVQRIEAPAAVVWQFVRASGRLQAYKHFTKSSEMVEGDGRSVGSRRRVTVVSGLPASTSEREAGDPGRGESGSELQGCWWGPQAEGSVNDVISANQVYCVVLEPYGVEIPEGNTWEDTRMFVDTIMKLNLQNLGEVAMAAAASLHGFEQLGSLQICD